MNTLMVNFKFEKRKKTIERELYAVIAIFGLLLIKGRTTL